MKDEPKPTCEGYGPDPLRKGDTVRLTESRFSHTRRKDVPTGTEGVILAVRHLPSDDESQALVKFKGFRWPLSLPLAKLERVTPVRILSKREVDDLLHGG